MVRSACHIRQTCLVILIISYGMYYNNSYDIRPVTFLIPNRVCLDVFAGCGHKVFYIYTIEIYCEQLFGEAELQWSITQVNLFSLSQH